MKTLGMLILTAALAAALAGHAATRTRDAVGLHWGEPTALGAGAARAWVAVDLDGTTSAIGVSIDEAALRTWTAGGETEALVPLPEDVAVNGLTRERAALRVRYDRDGGRYIVALEGLAPAAATLAATGAR
jgi:hypothetical protein